MFIVITSIPDLDSGSLDRFHGHNNSFCHLTKVFFILYNINMHIYSITLGLIGVTEFVTATFHFVDKSPSVSLVNTSLGVIVWTILTCETLRKCKHHYGKIYKFSHLSFFMPMYVVPPIARRNGTLAQVPCLI